MFPESFSFVIHLINWLCMCCVCVGKCVHPTVLFTVTDPNNWAWLNCAGADSAHWAGWYAAKLALPNRIWTIDQWRAGKRTFSLLALHNQRELTESWQLCSLWGSPRSCSCSTISSNEREEESKKIARLLWDFPVFFLSHSHIKSLKAHAFLVFSVLLLKNVSKYTWLALFWLN